MLQLDEHPEGCILRVRVRAGARRNEIVGLHGGMLRIDVTQAPEQGKANKAVIERLSEGLGIPKSSIELLSGVRSPFKKLLVKGLDAAQLGARLEPYTSQN